MNYEQRNAFIVFRCFFNNVNEFDLFKKACNTFIYLLHLIYDVVKEVMSMNEYELVKAAKSGDKDAFCSLYGLYKDRLYRYAYYRLNNSQDAQDAVQDCVVSAFEQINTLKSCKAFPSWIFTILRGVCTKYIKLQINQRRSVDMNEASNLFNIMSDDSTVLSGALEILNPQERDIVLLSIVAGFTSKEISRIIGLTSGSVRSKLSRSLAKMRDYLE